jgi:hypothetical protein
VKAIYLSLSGLAVLLALHYAVDAQSPPARRGAQAKPAVAGKKAAVGKYKRPTRVVRPKGVIRPKLGVGTVLTYTNFAVNFQDGSPLGDENGQPLRATQIRVWAPEVNWTPDSNRSRITSPTGSGGSAPGTFRYPGFNVGGIVLNQPSGTTQNVSGTTRDNAQVLLFSNGADIIANVNDAVGFYADNGGAFDLVVEILQL